MPWIAHFKSWIARFKALLVRRKRPIRIVAAILSILIVADLVTGAVIRARMASELQKKFGIELHVKFAWYMPPWGVSLHGVRMTKEGPDGGQAEIFSASRVVIKLNSYPKTDAAKPESIEIRELRISNGRVAYETAEGKPLVIEHINVALTPADGAKRLYRFSVAADQPANQMEGSGTIKMDGQTLAVSEFTLQAKVGAILEQVPLSDSARKTLAGCEVNGNLVVKGTASFPLHDWRRVSFQGDVQLNSARALFPASHLNIDKTEADFHIDGSGGISAMRVTCRSLQVASKGTMISLESGEYSPDADGNHWHCSGLRGRVDVAGGVAVLDFVHLRGQFVFTGAASGPMQLPHDATLLTAVEHEFIFFARGVSIQPPHYPIPITAIHGGPIAFRGGLVRFKDLEGEYGCDKALLKEARVTLDDPRQRMRIEDLRKQIRIEGITGTLICQQPGPRYPDGLGAVMAQLRPSGPFLIGGGSWFAANLPVPGNPKHPKHDFFFRISSVDGAFALTDHQAPLTSIRGDASVSPMLVDITSFRANCLGGIVIADGKITPTPPIHYDGTATFYNVNLDAARRDLGWTMDKPIAGMLYLKAQVCGNGVGGKTTPLQSLCAKGEFEVVDGNFGDVAALRSAAEKVTKPDQPMDGAAAGVFTIGDQKLTLQNCGLGNAVFGLQGTGTIGFDKALDLHAVAAPLGDWRTSLKQSKVPVLDSVGSDLVGAIQQLFNGAQRVLLWDLHISGTTTAPKVEFAPAPIITEPVAALFAQLLRDDKKQHLIDTVRPATK